MKWHLILLFCFGILICGGCRNEPEKKAPQPVQDRTPQVSIVFRGCRTCHPAVSNDRNHDFSCSQCHKGNEEGRDRETAHTGLVAQPAKPDVMEENCGGCHPDEVKNAKNSLHFTLAKEINRIREHFGLSDAPEGLTAISSSSHPATTEELVDDMLRRRCLRCHPYSPGDTYAYTSRGTGCAACHMSFDNGKLVNHEMIRLPGDRQCQGCHYANFAGADYYGRFEHDFSREYRTPFTTKEEYIRPYGVEYHELAPDIHQQKRLACIDCHAVHQDPADKGSRKITCRTCHQISPNEKAKDLPPNLKIDPITLLLTAKLTGEVHPIPQLTNQAHEQYGDEVACQVCHAQWSFNDTTTHLLRNDTDDFFPWALLYVQSSSTVEELLKNNIYSDNDEMPPAMPDTVTGKEFPGVWYKGFTERRWERMLIRKDSDGIIKVFRPILDMRLSYIDDEENVVFDNLQGAGQALLPYTPHTTGRAGMFFLDRFSHLRTPQPETAPDQ